MSESYDRYAIVVSDFNEDVTSKLLQGASQRFAEKGVEESALTVIHVPGAIELPLIAKLLAKSKKYDAVICLGSVIRGDTDHYDYVCQQVSAGCMQVTLGTDIPVIFGVLTTNTIEQAFDRVGGKEGHKGKDAADTALAMVKVIKNMGKAIEPNKGVFGFV